MKVQASTKPHSCSYTTKQPTPLLAKDKKAVRIVAAQRQENERLEREKLRQENDHKKQMERLEK